MLLDIGVGILLTIWTSWFFQVDLTFFLIFFGILFSLLPDADFFVEFIKHGSVGGKVIREHRELTHFPLFYVPVVFVIFFLFGGIWSVFLGLGLLAHFLHDSVGIGWGIKWLWPFSKRAYKLFAGKNGRVSSKLLVSWDSEELTKVAAEHGDPDWIRNIYLRPHPINVIEFLFFIGSIVGLYFYLVY